MAVSAPPGTPNCPDHRYHCGRASLHSRQSCTLSLMSARFSTFSRFMGVLGMMGTFPCNSTAGVAASCS